MAILVANGASGVSGPTKPACWNMAGMPPPVNTLNARTGGTGGAPQTLWVSISSRNGRPIATPHAPRSMVLRLRLRLYFMASSLRLREALRFSLDRRVNEVRTGRDGHHEIRERRLR